MGWSSDSSRWLRDAVLVGGLFGIICAAAPRSDAGFADSGALLPRPGRVLVHDFKSTPSEVQLDTGLGSRLSRLMGGEQQGSEKQAADAGAVVEAISQTLVQQIGSLGLPAERADASTALRAGEKVLIIEGRITSIDEGNRTRRNVIGLGAGASEVGADAELFYQSPGAAPLLLTGLDLSARSKRTPGMAETMGVGAAAGHAATSAAIGGGLHAYDERHDATVESDGSRLAKDLARKLASFFAAQGWISRDAEPKD